METPIQSLGKYKLPKTLSGKIETETISCDIQMRGKYERKLN